MDCKEFSANHSAFIDDTLPGYLMTGMRDHVAACARCSRRDTEIRRALFLLKNLPPVQVSAGFEERLRDRITAEGPAFHPEKVRRQPHLMWAAVATFAVALAGVQGWRAQLVNEAVRLPAVVTSVPATLESDEASAPAYVASMSTGIPMWPALMLAEEGPLRFADTQSAIWAATRP